MPTVSMHEAKSQLSKLVRAVESGEADEVIITRNGRPVARLTAMPTVAGTSVRIGIARGLFAAPADTSEQDAEVVALFTSRRG